MEMFEVRERIERTERAILVGVEWTDVSYGAQEARGGYDGTGSLVELAALADAAGLDVLCQVMQRRARPDPASLIGRGKVEELRVLNEELRADVFVFDEDLTPGQIRNLERAFDVKVIDRTDLILDIFAQRARTKEARLQVELAQLETALPRLRRAWTHLSRVGGGSGVGGGVGTRGPGETQLEMDRRLIGRRIGQLRKELRAVLRHRRVQRQGRQEQHVYSVALVGYTNAGKSSLMNALAGERHVATENKPFKTLDPTSRRIELADGRAVVLTDTVGFIQRLPHRLVAAFRATLEEVSEADLLLHVVDASHPYAAEQIAAVNEVLAEIGAREVPALLALNKVDLIRDVGRLSEIRETFPDAIPVSAKTGEGIEALNERLSACAGTLEREYLFRLPHEDGRLLSYLYSRGHVAEVTYGDTDVTVRAHLDPRYMTPLASYLVREPTTT